MEITAPKKLLNVNVHTVLATAIKLLIVENTVLKNYTYVASLRIDILFVGSTAPEMLLNVNVHTMLATAIKLLIVWNTVLKNYTPVP